MSARDVFPEACTTIAAAVREAADADTDAPTPCAEYDVGELARHFTGTTGAMARAGRDHALDGDDPWGSKTSLGEDWAGTLATNLEAIPDAWARPEAWEGDIDTGGGEMPAAAVGEMALVEVMLHGWDLAAATGQRLQVSAELGAELLRCVSETAEQGRQLGAYAEQVQVRDGGSDFDRALGEAGRDPTWTP